MPPYKSHLVFWSHDPLSCKLYCNRCRSHALFLAFTTPWPQVVFLSAPHDVLLDRTKHRKIDYMTNKVGALTCSRNPACRTEALELGWGGGLARTVC